MPQQFHAQPVGAQLRVLDFGGGNGLHYKALKKGLCERGCSETAIEWNIVETQECVDKYKNSELDEPQLKWFSSIDELDGEMDIVYSEASLRYVENYDEMLSKLMSFDPYYIFLHRSTIGRHNTCLAKQLFGRKRIEDGSYEPGQSATDNYGIVRNDKTMHFWFVNEESFRAHIDSHGYKIYHKQPFNVHPRYKIVEGELHSHNDHWGNPRAETNNFILKQKGQRARWEYEGRSSEQLSHIENILLRYSTREKGDDA